MMNVSFFNSVEQDAIDGETDVVCCYGIKLSCRSSADESLEDGHVKVLDGPCDESHEVNFVDRADWVDVGRGA